MPHQHSASSQKPKRTSPPPWAQQGGQSRSRVLAHRATLFGPWWLWRVRQRLTVESTVDGWIDLFCCLHSDERIRTMVDVCNKVSQVHPFPNVPVFTEGPPVVAWSFPRCLVVVSSELLVVDFIHVHHPANYESSHYESSHSPSLFFRPTSCRKPFIDVGPTNSHSSSMAFQCLFPLQRPPSRCMKR